MIKHISVGKEKERFHMSIFQYLPLRTSHGQAGALLRGRLVLVELLQRSLRQWRAEPGAERASRTQCLGQVPGHRLGRCLFFQKLLYKFRYNRRACFLLLFLLWCVVIVLQMSWNL